MPDRAVQPTDAIEQVGQAKRVPIERDEDPPGRLEIPAELAAGRGDQPRSAQAIFAPPGA